MSTLRKSQQRKNTNESHVALGSRNCFDARVPCAGTGRVRDVDEARACEEMVRGEINDDDGLRYGSASGREVAVGGDHAQRYGDRLFRRVSRDRSTAAVAENRTVRGD